MYEYTYCIIHVHVHVLHHAQHTIHYRTGHYIAVDNGISVWVSGYCRLWHASSKAHTLASVWLYYTLPHTLYMYMWPIGG